MLVLASLSRVAIGEKSPGLDRLDGLLGSVGR
jgi:hypothetical protein